MRKARSSVGSSELPVPSCRELLSGSLGLDRHDIVSPGCSHSQNADFLYFNIMFAGPGHLRYDFAVYGLLAPEIGGAFFPDASEKLQLINSFGVYLAAFLMRYDVF